MPLDRPTPIEPLSMQVGNSSCLHWIAAAIFAILAKQTGKILTRPPGLEPVGWNVSVGETLLIPTSCGVQLISFMNLATPYEARISEGR
jgi:hypothetical protein